MTARSEWGARKVSRAPGRMRRGVCVAAAVGLLAVLLIEPVAAAERRGYTADLFVIEIEHVLAGQLEDAQEQKLPQAPPRFGLGLPGAAAKWTPPQPGELDVTIKVGTGMSRSFWNLVADAIDGKPREFDGSIKVIDYNRDVMHALDISRATITKVRLPALDTASADAAVAEVRLHVADGKDMKGEGKVAPAPPPGPRWTTSRYRLTVGTLDGASVTHIDAIDLPIRAAKPAPADVQFVVRGPAADQYLKLARAFEQPNYPRMNARLEYLTLDGRTAFILGLDDIFLRIGGGDPTRAAAPSVTLHVSSEHVTFSAVP
jgi:hypothetical protein